jgi:hypothetical protein
MGETQENHLDAVPESLEAAEAEHAQIMDWINQAQQQIQQIQQEGQQALARGRFLEGVIAQMRKPRVPRTAKKGA